MKFDIKSRFSGSVIFTAEIDATDETPLSVRIGLAVRLAIKEKANLRGANLRYSDLQDADLRGANLQDANLRYSDLRGADLLAVGNMREMRTLQFDMWMIGYTKDTLQIGCQRHAIDKWRKWDTPAGRRWIAQMDGEAAEWAERNLALVLSIIDANPAE